MLTHENVLLPVVSMQVQVKKHVFLLIDLLQQLLSIVNGRMVLLARFDPLTIQIHCAEVGPVVSSDNSINVQHWDYEEQKVVPQDFGQETRPCQNGNNPFHDVGGHVFTRVHSRADANGFTVFE